MATATTERSVALLDEDAAPGSEQIAESWKVEAARSRGALDSGQRCVYKKLPAGWFLCIVAGRNRELICRPEEDPRPRLDEFAERREKFEQYDRLAQPFLKVLLADGSSARVRPVSRPLRGRTREARRSGAVTRRSAGAPTSSDDGPEPPPLARVCRGCGRFFQTRVPQRKYCDDRCKSRTLVAQHRTRLRGQASPTSLEQVLLEHEARAVAAVRNGADPLDALTVLVAPPDEGLLRREAVAA